MDNIVKALKDTDPNQARLDTKFPPKFWELFAAYTEKFGEEPPLGILDFPPVTITILEVAIGTNKKIQPLPESEVIY